MEKTRTENTVKNIKAGITVQIVNKLLAFVVRTVFIRTLNSEYLGVSGLFTNILTMLSFTELGIGTAIIFSMYKPIAESDIEKIKSLMRLYKGCYTMIGIIVFLLGLLVIPFMDFIITDIPNIKENIIFIYILFLFNTSSSYFFTYKKSIITAYQMQRVIDNIDSIYYFVKSILEIVFLILTRNYIVYLLIQIISTFVENVVIAKKAEKMFPFIKEARVKKLSRKEGLNIFNNVKSLVIYKFGGVIMTGTDNILISALINVNTVGLCSNYSMIITSVRAIILSALNGVTASVGNLNAETDIQKKENVFYQMTFINFMVYSFCAISLIVLLNPFIKLWLGNDYLMSIGVAIALSVSFFIEGLRNPAYTYRTTLGLFNRGKITPYLGAISNLIFSILLCKIFGVTGIFIGTSLSQLISYSWMDPYLIHKYEFKTSVKKYFQKFLIYMLVFSLNVAICLYITSFIQDVGWMNFILKGLIVLIVPTLLNVILFRKSTEFRALMDRFIYPNINKILRR